MATTTTPTATTTDTTATDAKKKLARDEYINQMYDANLNAQKAQLQQNYDQGMAELDTEQRQAQQQTQQNLNRTYVEGNKAARNYGEVQNAYGLSSGAMAQAKLAYDTTLQRDMTELRGIQMNADADIERQRTLLAKQYSDAIAKAQSENDMARAEALYKDAAAKETELLNMQKEIANLFATKKKDYSYYQKLYDLTDEQMKQLVGRNGSGDRGKGYTIRSTRPGTTSSTSTKPNSSASNSTLISAITGR